MRRNTTKPSLIEHRFNTGFTSSLVCRGSRVEDSRHVIYWSRAGLYSTSFPEWVWRALKLTVERFKGLSYLCFKRLPRTEFYDYCTVPNDIYSPSSCSVCQPSMPLQSVTLMELLQTDGSPLLDRSEQLPNHICETVFSQVDLYLNKTPADWYRIDNETEGWRPQRKNNFLEVDLYVNLKSKKLSLCHRPGCWEIYDREMSLFCMPSGEKVCTIYARSTKCGKKVRVWSLFWIAEFRWLDLTENYRSISCEKKSTPIPGFIKARESDKKGIVIPFCCV